MGKWQCDGGDVWATLCRTKGIKPPPPVPIPTNQRNMTVYSNAAAVELFVNGASYGVRNLPLQSNKQGAPQVQSWAEWLNITWANGNVTAIARDAAGVAVATHTRWTTREAASLMISVDVPSPISGTGAKLLLDGQDTALVRASVLDAAGRVVHDGNNSVTFKVVSGPGRLVGTHNGFVGSHGRNDNATMRAYHGLVRAVVMVTSVAGRTLAERNLIEAIDLDAVHIKGHDGIVADEAIVLEASAIGLPPAHISIPVSANLEADGVLAIAAAAAGKPASFY
jgi:hypothetical protein